MYGYAGRMLTVDLTKREIKKEPLRQDLVKDYIGGEGFGARLLWEKLKPGLDPLGPDNLLIFSTTAFSGTEFPTGSRTVLCYKSPLTNYFGVNVMGGHFSPALRWAGYDILIVQGKADSPVYIYIENDKVEIRDAGRLWGKIGLETDEMLKEEIGNPDIQILRIGPAGEKLIRLACITAEYNRGFGKGGNGAVAGSKNLKAIVVEGSGATRIPVYDSLWLRDVATKINRKGKTGIGALFKAKHMHWGHSFFAEILGIIPSRHFQRAYVKRKDAKGLRCDNIMKKLHTGEDTYCWGCPVRGGKILSPKDGPYKGHRVEAKFEAVTAWGYNMMINDLDILCEIFYLCAQYGVDVNGASEWAMWLAECQERGILTPEDCGGLEVKFGDGESCIRLLKAIFCREGIGDILAEGPKIAAEKLGKGSEKYVIHVKGSPLESEDFVGDKALLLGTATTERGGGVNRNFTYPISFGMLPPPIKGVFRLLIALPAIMPVLIIYALISPFLVFKHTTRRFLRILWSKRSLLAASRMYKVLPYGIKNAFPFIKEFAYSQTTMLQTEVTGLKVNPDPTEEKGISRWLKPYKEALPGMLNSMGGCLILWWFAQLKTVDLLEGYQHLTGREISIKEGLKIGEKIINLERAFNAREGFSRKDDTAPKRFLDEPLKGGKNAGLRVKDFDAMIDEFYTECGFDLKTGWPTKHKLEGLGLKDIAEALYS